jgi:Phytochelatin synthase
VLTGDWDGPHISPIGAYDRDARQVLIMDVDREWYVPYWSPDRARRAWAARRRDRRPGLDQAVRSHPRLRQPARQLKLSSRVRPDEH